MSKKLFIALVISGLALSGCNLLTNANVNTGRANVNGSAGVMADDESMAEDDSMMEKDDDAMTEKDGDSMTEKDDDAMTEKDGDSMMENEVSYSGTILAGSTSPVIDFNQSDYDKALAANKDIVLYFYANWCPVCKAEVPSFYSAMSSFNDENLVAFRVNFNDSDTDANEEALAKTHGVPYQHTKVFIKNGKRILKSPATWGSADYVAQINAAFNS